MTQLDIHIGHAKGHLGHAKGHRDRRHELTGQDLAEIVRLLECKLAWYGFRSVKVGPFIRIKGRKVFIDLLDGGKVLSRIELDPESGVPDPGHVVRALDPSLLTMALADLGAEVQR